MQPEIRFNGFSDDWVEKKLGDVSNLIQGAAWKSSEYLETGPNLLITISNLKSAIVDTSFGNRLAEVSLDLQKKYGIANNDVLVSMTGNVGRVSIYKDCIGAPKALLNQRVGKVIPVNIDNLFLYAILRNELFERKMIDKGQGAAQLNISSKDIQQFPIQLPTLPEQQKIGGLFSKYDAIIALREQKLEELNALKKGLLQQMFPKNGAKVPELRFGGFADDWVEKKLGTESTITAGGDIDKSKLKEFGEYPIFANALTNDGTVGYYDSYYRVEAPAVTVTGRGDVGHAKARKVNFTPVVRLLAVKSNHDVDFLENAINNHKVLVESTGVPQLTVPQLENYKIFFPTGEEQQKIGQLFKHLDARISNEQIKIEQLKAQKQGLLQRML